MHSAYVLGAYWDANHGNHVHVDNSQGHANGGNTPPLRKGSRADTILVQMAGNFLNRAGLAIDGDFGPLTTTAYNNLASPAKVNLRCPIRPTTS